jgi:hypothetical protein
MAYAAFTIRLGRDPYARRTIRCHGTCSWCGNTNRHGRVYQYFIDDDNPRNSGDIKGVFCSIGCANDYHG